MPSKRDTQLLARLRAYRFDADGPLPFGARLAREQGWSRARAERVIEEYRRFVFLAVAAGHPVSPSDDVDQAWHLHLCATEEYWGRFCPKVLGGPLHHAPSRGGPAEAGKHERWYRDTLSSYRCFFGEPPADIWPSPELRRCGERHVRVDRGQAWIVPRWSVGLVLGAAASGAFAALTWSLLGADFPLSFVASATVHASLALMVTTPRRKARGKVDGLAPCEVAYLAGGVDRAVNVAITDLVCREKLTLRGDDGFALGAAKRDTPRADSPYRKREDDDGAEEEHVLARALLRAVRESGPLELAALRGAVAHAVEEVGARLEIRGLVHPPDRARREAWTRMGLIAAPLALGAAWFVRGFLLGLPRESHPIFFFLACLGLLLLFFLVGARKAHLTPHGEAVLGELRKRFGASAGQAGNVALQVALSGAQVLWGGPHEALARRLGAHAPPTASEGGGCGCGGGGCGGGCGG